MTSFLHDAHPRLEAAFVAMLDESLAPRDPSMMLATVRSFDLPPDSIALDVGCGEGAHAFRLAAHFGLRVLGIDPVQRHLDLAREARRSEPEEIASRVSFERGTADRIPLRDASVDLVWCRDTLAHAPSLASAYGSSPGCCVRVDGRWSTRSWPPTCSRPRRPTGSSP